MVLQDVKNPSRMIIGIKNSIEPNLTQYQIPQLPSHWDKNSIELNLTLSMKSHNCLHTRANILLIFPHFTEKIANVFQSCEKRFDQRLKTLEVIDSQTDYLWGQLNVEIKKAGKDARGARNQVNRNNIAMINTVILGNILKLAGRVKCFVINRSTFPNITLKRFTTFF